MTIKFQLNVPENKNGKMKTQTFSVELCAAKSRMPIQLSLTNFAKMCVLVETEIYFSLNKNKMHI